MQVLYIIEIQSSFSTGDIVYLQQICNRQQNTDLKRKGKEKGCVCLLELIMFQFHENSFRSPCLQAFKTRRRNTRKSNNKLIHVYAPKAGTCQKTCQSKVQSKREVSRLHQISEKEISLIEEIDGVQFYRTTLPVCESVANSFIPKRKVRKSLKIKDQPSTIVLPETEGRGRSKPRTKKGRRLFDKQEPDTFTARDIFQGKENEQRKRRILDKLERDKENVLSRVEEEKIYERAEYYSMSITPDVKYLNLPEDDHSHIDDPAYVASTWGQQLEYPLPKKRKSRNVVTDSCYLSYYSPDDPYDNSQTLPCGTKLFRPPNKLVELVADAVIASPDGLLQVPQIYTVIMNRYPYFRYMAKTAVTSWRSSVRHALFQKLFKKLKFRTPDISSKGCFWCMNSQIDHTEINHVVTKNGSHFEDFDLDPKTHDAVKAFLNQEENECTQFVNQEEDIIMTGNCSIKVPVCDFKPREDNSFDPDPIMTTCTTAFGDSLYCCRKREVTLSAATKVDAILPISRCTSPYSDSSNSSSSLVSPLMNRVRPDILGVDPQLTSNNSVINWAPELPFDQLDRQIMYFENSQESEQGLSSSGYNYLNRDSVIMSESPDVSSGKSSPDMYDWWQPCTDINNELFYCLANNVVDSSMNFKSDDSTEIGYIIPDNIQWGLGQIDEMPTTIFDKDLMSSSPEHSVISVTSSP